jgi:hypothetical protein
MEVGTSYMTQQLTSEILNAALENLTSKRHEIDEQIAEARRLLGGSRNGAGKNGTPAAPEAAKRKRRISAVGRRAIAAAQRRRWAEQKAATGSSTEKAQRPKRKLSPAGRAAIVAALKKRWAAKKAEATKASTAGAKSSRPKAA